MAKLGLFLMIVGGTIAPLMSARAVRAAILGVEASHGELFAAAGGMSQALAALAAGFTVGFSGFVIVMISKYRVSDSVEHRAE